MNTFQRIIKILFRVLGQGYSVRRLAAPLVSIPHCRLDLVLGIGWTGVSVHVERPGRREEVPAAHEPLVGVPHKLPLTFGTQPQRCHAIVKGDRRPLPVLRRRPPQRDLRRHEDGSGEAVSVGRSHNLTGRAPFPAEGAQLAGWRVASSRRRRTAGEPLQKLSSCDPAFSHMSIPGSKTWARALKGTSTLARLSRRFQQSRTSPIGVVWQKASSSMPNSFGRDVGAYPCQGVPP